MRCPVLRSVLLSVMASLAAAPPATAQEIPACDRFAWSVKREQVAFAAPDRPALASGSVLPSGTMASTLQLGPVAAIAFPVRPERTPKPATFGGFVTAPAIPGGVYQVTVSDEAWIDVSQDGTTSLKSLGQSGQKGCPSVRKSLRFQLDAAPVTIQISGSGAERISVGLFKAE